MTVMTRLRFHALGLRPIRINLHRTSQVSGFLSFPILSFMELCGKAPLLWHIARSQLQHLIQPVRSRWDMLKFSTPKRFLTGCCRFVLDSWQISLYFIWVKLSWNASQCNNVSWKGYPVHRPTPMWWKLRRHDGEMRAKGIEIQSVVVSSPEVFWIATRKINFLASRWLR